MPGVPPPFLPYCVCIYLLPPLHAMTAPCITAAGMLPHFTITSPSVTSLSASCLRTSRLSWFPATYSPSIRTPSRGTLSHFHMDGLNVAALVASLAAGACEGFPPLETKPQHRTTLPVWWTCKFPNDWTYHCGRQAVVAWRDVAMPACAPKRFADLP